MSGSNHDQMHTARETHDLAARQPNRRDVLEEEEKILAGRSDVNMPALLTRDSQGG